MQSVKYLAAVLVFLSSSCFAQYSHCEIAGVWKHADKSAWLEVNLESKTVNVKSHLDNPEANGRTIIKNLTNSFSGEMYNASTAEYVTVELSFNGCEQLTVTFDDVNVLTLNRD